jgi:hypothetical protein
MSDPDLRTISEDANAGMATPLMDLMAAGVLVAIAVWFAVDALRLPVPGDLITAPGLLPFLTAASLLVMALMLGASALGRRRAARAGARIVDGLDLPPDFWRTMGLGAILTVYIAAMQLLPVSAAFTLGSLRFVIGSFEVASVIALTAILRVFWQAPLAHCLGVSVVWIVFLSIVFRMIFHVQLP